MRDDGIYHEILTLRLDQQFLGQLKDFISKINHLICWEEFGRVPFSTSDTSLRIFCRDIFNVKLRKAYIYLAQSPAHFYLLHGLSERSSPKASTLFKFLCMNASVDESELRDVIDPTTINHYVSSGLFIRRDNKLVLPITLVPYRNYFYVSEAIHVIDNRDLYGIRPTYIGNQTHLQIEYLKRRLRDCPIVDMLEMGCGTGIVSLEMRDIAYRRQGVEIYERSLEFALANKELWNDTGMLFHRSDLFANVQGKYDLIVFYPWTPSERSLNLTMRFLEEAPRFLTDEGNIMLVLSSKSVNGKDVVIDEISKLLCKYSLRASRDIFCSGYVEEPDGTRAVYSDYFLWIERGTVTDRRGRGDLIRTNISLNGVVSLARRLLNDSYPRKRKVFS